MEPSRRFHAAEQTNLKSDVKASWHRGLAADGRGRREWSHSPRPMDVGLNDLARSWTTDEIRFPLARSCGMFGGD